MKRFEEYLITIQELNSRGLGPSNAETIGAEKQDVDDENSYRDELFNILQNMKDTNKRKELWKQVSMANGPQLVELYNKIKGSKQ